MIYGAFPPRVSTRFTGSHFLPIHHYCVIASDTTATTAFIDCSLDIVNKKEVYFRNLEFHIYQRAQQPCTGNVLFPCPYFYTKRHKDDCTFFMRREYGTDSLLFVSFFLFKILPSHIYNVFTPLNQYVHTLYTFTHKYT